MSDEYWTVDVPGLTEQQAARLVEFVNAERLGHFGVTSALDP